MAIPPRDCISDDNSGASNELIAAHLGSSAVEFAPETRLVLARTWNIASHLRHSSATTEHLLISLLLGGGDNAKQLVKLAKVEKTKRTDDPTIGLISGALVRVASLSLAVGQTPIHKLRPNDKLTDWIASAKNVGGLAPITPDHLITVLDEANREPIRAHIVNRLANMRRVGTPLSELVRSRQGIESTSQTTSRMRADVRSRLTNLKRAVADLPEQLGQRQSAAVMATLVNDVNQLSNRTADLDVRTAAAIRGHIDGHNADLRDLIGKLAGAKKSEPDPALLDVVDRLGAVERALPKPPSALFLTVAIATVILFGTAAGIGLGQLTKLLP